MPDPSPQLIDRVARALQDHDLIGGSSYWRWDELHPERQAELIDMARAAIDAMPGPLEYDLPQTIALDTIRDLLADTAPIAVSSARELVAQFRDQWDHAGQLTGTPVGNFLDDLDAILDTTQEPR